MSGHYPIERLCETMLVSRSGFYDWRRRRQTPARVSGRILGCASESVAPSSRADEPTAARAWRGRWVVGAVAIASRV